MSSASPTSDRARDLQARLREFMHAHIYPNEALFHEQLEAGATRFATPPVLEELKARAREAGLWNLFLPRDDADGSTPRYGAGLTNLEYAPLCEVMGRVTWAPEVFNCNAPDTGNMEGAGVRPGGVGAGAGAVHRSLAPGHRRQRGRGTEAGRRV